jgi:hypothetical protein
VTGLRNATSRMAKLGAGNQTMKAVSDYSKDDEVRITPRRPISGVW